jgi:hypothetical protein
MGLYDRIANLPLEVEGYELERRELAVSTGFTRVTTVATFSGGGERGEGEDVTYQAADHDSFPRDLALEGSWTLRTFSERLDEQSLFDAEPSFHDAHDYRRWAFESAALDLALRQSNQSLGEALGRSPGPVRFVASTRGDPFAWLDAQPGLELKLDAQKDWDRDLMLRLASTDRVRTVDLKGYYRGTVVDLPPDPELYRAIAECFPDAVIEDAWLEDGCLEALAGAEDRLSFDAPVHSLANLDALPIEARWLNVKPSRFGTLARLFECIDACEERGIQMYGGGQFELGPGRRQIQTLASVLYAGGPSDVAPGDYNAGGPRPGLPTSPLPAATAAGF